MIYIIHHHTYPEKGLRGEHASWSLKLGRGYTCVLNVTQADHWRTQLCIGREGGLLHNTNHKSLCISTLDIIYLYLYLPFFNQQRNSTKFGETKICLYLYHAGTGVLEYWQGVVGSLCVF